EGNPNKANLHLSMIYILSGSNICIEDCTFENCNGWDPCLVGDFTTADVVSGLRVVNCDFVNCGPDDFSTDHSSLWMQVVGAVVANNRFQNPPAAASALQTSGAAIEIHGKNVTVTGNLVKGYCVGICWSTCASGGFFADSGNLTATGNTLEDVTVG